MSRNQGETLIASELAPENSEPPPFLQGPDRQFQDFLRSFTVNEGWKYRLRLASLSANNSPSLLIDFGDLMTHDPALARTILQKPDELLPILNLAASAQLKIEDPEYADTVKQVKVRFRHLPERCSPRLISAAHMGQLLMLDGIIVRATSLKPLLMRAAFQCRKCNAVVYIDQARTVMHGPGVCAHCRSKTFEFKETESIFINSQELRIQEKPEDLPPGQLPRSIDVKVTEDLVDVARPGDRVLITGQPRLIQDQLGKQVRLRTFEIVIDANYVEVSGKEIELVALTPEDERRIHDLAADPLIHRRLIKSIAPSIYGCMDIKEAILYMLMAGVPKQLADGMKIRGDANIILVGDPATAKSQLLQYVARIAPRGLYTSGRGSTAAGLTAAVLREKTGGMILEAGALVLADKGICCVDEGDKMRPEDRVAIHEAMEQNTVSVAKGGIVATLNARAAVLMAANPQMGRYNGYKTIADNLNLPITLLSRFDLYFIMRDTPDPAMDGELSHHVLHLHRYGSPPSEDVIPPDMLRKYITYAKRITPILSTEAMEEIQKYYLKMRSASSISEAPIAISPRQLEALIRLTEARARTLLKENADVEDARTVIRLMTLSLQEVGVDTETGKMDIDIIMTGKPRSQHEKFQAVLDLIRDLEKEHGPVEESPVSQIIQDKLRLDANEITELLRRLTKEGLLFNPKPGYVQRTNS